MRARLLPPRPKKMACSYHWFVSQKELNKRAHTINGNITYCVSCKRREAKDGCMRCQYCLDAAKLRQKRYREREKAAKAGLQIPRPSRPVEQGSQIMPPSSLAPQDNLRRPLQFRPCAQGPAAIPPSSSNTGVQEAQRDLQVCHQLITS